MQGASRAALAQSRDDLRALLSGDGVDAAGVGRELLEVTQVLDSSASLRRALAAPAAESEAKQALVERLLVGKVGDGVVQLLRRVVGHRWSSEKDIPDAAELLGVEATFSAADRRGRLDQVEHELFSFERLVAGNAELRDAVTNRQRAGADKATLVRRLLDGKVEPETEALAANAAAHPRGKRFAQAIESYIRISAAMHDQLTASVTVAVPLTPEHHDRLARALQTLYGQPVQTNVVVDRSILGGVRVQVGDEVIDGTIQRRLEEARRQMAG
ncbi:F0F1 ATP synthase subunit delta [Leekyejoonella antrihumi]|uniref:ATP synthase subunit delta n=1 Tax=Leekyejoonella antrihumi TaxID=1660198 RepID=A0A563E202_9MICO|nr:F0F1 ATP synthase subunit delta [Leekyejoonella antrihumi]TWP36567.1 F0F1 ATP synthase subunit delta [Leekyejoonella antrihumi]